MTTTTQEPQIQIFHFDPPRKAVERVTDGVKSRVDDSQIRAKWTPEDIEVTLKIAMLVLWSVAGFLLSITFFFLAWNQGRAMIAACLGA